MSNLLKSKFFLGVMIVAVMAVGFVAVSTASAATCTINSTLRQGSTGAEVVCLQTSLGNLTADGNFGPMTKAAVVHWQSISGLTADGVFGPMSRAMWMSNAGNTANFPSGCVSATGFSSTTGLLCTGGVSNLPAGCSTTAGFSSTSGASCSVTSNLPAGCSTTAGFSPTTGGSCSVTTNLPAGCSTTAGFSATTGASCATGVSTSTNGVGNITEVKKDSTYSQVELTSAQTDQKVIGFTIKADTGSDLTIQSLALDLKNTGAGSTNMNHYFDVVKIWDGSTLVGTANVADFSKSGTTYSRTISLNGATAKAGTTTEFFITVTSAANIDSADLAAANTWQPVVQSIRFEDGSGAIMTDSGTGIIGGATDLSTFSFVSLANSTGKTLKVSLTTGQDAINLAHVATVSSTATTTDVPMLAFDIKATGQINHITDIPVTVQTTEAADGVATIANSFTLWKDGVKIDTIDVSDGSSLNYSTPVTEVAACASGGGTNGCTISFSNIDFNMSDGQISHFVVKANLKKITAATDTTFEEGDGLTVTLTGGSASTSDIAHIVAEDINTDSFSYANGDFVGSASAALVTFHSTGIALALVNTTANVTVGASGQPDIGTYTMTFDVTAFGGDMWIDGTKPTLTGTDSTQLTILSPGTGTQDAIITSPTGATETGSINTTGRFLVAQDTTQRFMITSVVTPTGTGGLYSVQLTSLKYAASDVNITDALPALTYTTNLTNFVTPSINLKLTN